jgi:hypothetical protein
LQTSTRSGIKPPDSPCHDTIKSGQVDGSSSTCKEKNQYVVANRIRQTPVAIGNHAIAIRHIPKWDDILGKEIQGMS